MNNPWFPTIAQLDAYDEQRRREDREDRIDELIGDFLAQLHVTAQLPLAELNKPPDPTSVMADLD